MPWRRSLKLLLSSWSSSMHRTALIRTSPRILNMNALIGSWTTLTQNIGMSGNRRLSDCSITTLNQLVLWLIVKAELLLLTLLLLHILHLEILLSLISSRIKSIDIVVSLMKEIDHFWPLTVETSWSPSLILAIRNFLFRNKLTHILHWKNSRLLRNKLLNVPFSISARGMGSTIKLNMIHTFIASSSFRSIVCWSIIQSKSLVWLLLTTWWPL